MSQPCIGQVLGDSFTEIESLGAPEHFCEDELLSILNSDRRSEQPEVQQAFMLFNFISFLYRIYIHIYIYKFCAHVSCRKNLTLKYYAKKILYFLRQQNILRSLKGFLERPPEQQSALEGQNDGVVF